MPIAYLAARRPGRAARVIEIIATAGFALPGVVVALGLVFFATRFAGAIYQTLLLLVLAYVIRFLPQAVGALAQRDPARRPGARGGRARPRSRPHASVFRRITLPLAAPGVAGRRDAGLSDGDEGAAGHADPQTDRLRDAGHANLGGRPDRLYAAAAVPSLILIAISAVALSSGSSDRADPGQPRGHD